MMFLNPLRTFLISFLALALGLNFLSNDNVKTLEMSDNTPISVNLGVAGRSTYNNSFEAGELIELPVSLKNISEQPVVVDTYFKTELVNIVVQTPKGEILAIDPYKQKQRHYEDAFGKTPLRVPQRAIDFKRLNPGESLSLSDIPVLWEGVSSPLDFTLPHKVISQPGEYTVEIFYRPKENREFANIQAWNGEVRSNSQKIRILNDDELARLEAQFPIKREEALRIARSAAIRHFDNESRVEVHGPIRLRIQKEKKWYDVSFVQDNGLTARWIRVLVDASTGKLTINPFGEGA